ncbi:hypothetical protein AAXB25_15200 [Paenibacillus lautus]|uniref:hypothetical protein n=1 Tax=Paenibacillus lautus TaxID=1401 RepID=UPI003D276662
MSKHTIKIPIGDWSDDGHGKYKVFEIESNYPAFDLQEAYKASCKLVGVQFNHNENYMGIPIDSYWDNPRLICTEYEDSSLSEFARDALIEHGLDLDEIMEGGEGALWDETFTNLLLAFIGLSMPKDWEWNAIKDRSSYLNGFWNDNLNVQFGYGLFN